VEPKHPRIWTLFLLFFAGLGVQLAVGVLLLIPALLEVDWSSGAPDVEFFEAYLERPTVLLGSLVSTQVGLMLLLGLAVSASATPWRERLALRWGSASPAWLPLWVLATLGTGSLVSLLLDLEQSSYAQDLVSALDAATLPVAVGFVLLGSVLPGLVEELMFRGYIQHRLQRRFPAWFSVGLTGVAFAVYHLEPLYILATIPIGVWLSFLAWKLDGIVPGIICHAFNNFLVFVLMAFFPSVRTLSGPVAWAIDGTLIACLVVAVGVLVRWPMQTKPLSVQLTG